MGVAAVEVTQKERKPIPETVLRDFVRFSWRATRGLTRAAEAEGRELIQRMTGAGHITYDEGERLLKMLTSRMQQSRVRFEKRIETSLLKAVERLSEISVNELSHLSNQVAQLESRLNDLLKKKGRKK